jgi:hypothetical protein
MHLVCWLWVVEVLAELLILLQMSMLELAVEVLAEYTKIETPQSIQDPHILSLSVPEV